MTDFVTIEGRALRQPMKVITDIVERRNTIPILSTVRLTHSSAGLLLEATDLDAYMTATLDVIDGQGDWSLCLDASIIDRLARIAGPMDLRIAPSEDGAKVTLDGGIASYDIHTLPAHDFPEMSGERQGQIEAFSNGSFAALLDKVRWCVSTEETRYYLNGVCWQIRNSGRRFVATDGHRLAACRYTSEDGDETSRIIPRKTVDLVCKHLAGKDVKVFATGNDLVIDIVSPEFTIRSKLIDGTYPDVDRVIPDKDKMTFQFDLKRDEIMTAIEQATIFRPESGRGIRFHNDNGHMALEQKSADFGTAKAVTSVAWPEAAKDFGFNARYVREIAANCASQMTLHMNDAGSPFSITDEDKTMTRVLMPMRV